MATSIERRDWVSRRLGAAVARESREIESLRRHHPLLSDGELVARGEGRLFWPLPLRTDPPTTSGD
jgi:hypothetical protein